MTKTTTKKTAAPAPVVAQKATRKRGAVLVKKTASELHKLIGDTPIGVSNKELKAILLSRHSVKVLSDAGLK